MKQTFLFIIALLCITHARAQKLILPQKGEVTLDEKATACSHKIRIRVIDLAPDKEFSIRLLDVDTSSAVLGQDYSYLTDITKPMVISGTTPERDIEIQIPASSGEKAEMVFRLALIYTVNCRADTQNLTVTIKPFAEKKKARSLVLTDTSKWKLRIVTGGNFDFFDAPAFKDFAGDLNVFVPDLLNVKIKEKTRNNGKKREAGKVGIGLQVGIFNFRYYDEDSSKGRTYTDRYLVDPTATDIEPGTTRYVRDVYSYKSKTSYNTFGAYFNPMVTLKHSKFFDMYANVHIEVLWRTEVIKDSKMGIRQDTLTYTQNDADAGVALQSYPGLRPEYQRKQYNDTYVGIGLPMRVDMPGVFDLFVTPTIGRAGYDGIEVVTETINNIVHRTYVPVRRKETFMMTKAQLMSSVAGVNVILGGEFRHIKSQRNYYAVYLGAAFPLDKLKK